MKSIYFSIFLSLPFERAGIKFWSIIFCIISTVQAPLDLVYIQYTL